nr:septal ring lytic transglycosylase RlpA family protein [Roseibium aestuarii]
MGLCLCVAAAVLAGCAETPEIKSKFSPKKYGVKASPKVVADGQPVPKGGGRYMVGKPYKVAGRWYKPELDESYEAEGLSSWYGPTFHGRQTANGEVFDKTALTAAHPTMPLPSYARVTNLKNGRSMIVRVNDRGPFHGNRVIDVSERVASLLGTKQAGVAKVKVEYVGPAQLDGRDESYLLASLSGPDAVQPGATMPGTMLASVSPSQLPPAAASGVPGDMASGPALYSPATGFASGSPVPLSRPYGSLIAVASAQTPGQTPATVAATQVALAFDPALAYEASIQSVQLASTNPFVAVSGPEAAAPVAAAPSATNAFVAPASASTSSSLQSGGQATGVLGTMVLPTASPRLSSGSAISSFAATGRISAAYQALAEVSGNSISLHDLAARQN